MQWPPCGILPAELIFFIIDYILVGNKYSFCVVLSGILEKFVNDFGFLFFFIFLCKKV